VELSAADAFILGAASKALATCVTYPAIRCKVLLQTGEAESLAGAARQAAGGAGLYRGLGAQLLKTVLVAALQLSVKEKAYRSAYWLVQHLLGVAEAQRARRTVLRVINR
jgi:hypothetical protein